MHHPNEVIKLLENSEFKFYLTGSRFFGGYTANSDYDYFAKATDPVRHYLSWLGFDEDTISMDYFPADANTTAVFTSPCKKIQVQLQYDVEAKLRIQSIIKSSIPQFQFFEKYVRKSIWVAMYKAHSTVSILSQRSSKINLGCNV